MRYGEAVDFFIRGEGEESMLRLVNALAAGTSDFSAVPRLVWRDADSRVRENPPGALPRPR